MSDTSPPVAGSSDRVRVVILTSLRHSTASHCLPALAHDPGIEVARVVFAEAHYRTRGQKLRRDLKKAWRIGPLGTLTGLAIRPWFAGPPCEDLFAVAARLGVDVAVTPRTNAPRTAELFREARADLGISLGCSYISPKVFAVPAHGMINVHGEILPRFRGALSVIWPLYENLRETGFTIHQVDKGIDTGAILYQERYPIALRPTLGATVRASVAETFERVPPALARVVAGYSGFRARGSVQTGGVSYTTPTFWQMLRIRRNHRAWLREERGGAA